MFGLAGWCWAVTAVYAGPINAEALAPTGLDEGLSVGFDGSFSLARGNVEWLDIGGAARVQHQSLYEPSVEPDMLPFVRQRWFGTVDLRFAERPDGPFINRGFSHARWTQMWSRRLGTEVFAQYAFDEFLRLQSRGLVGAGVRGVVRNRRDVSAWFGSGAMWETENIDVVEGSSDDTQTNVLRWTNYVTFRLDPWDSALLLQNTVYFQPSFADLSDYRLLEELEALAQVTEVFGLGLALSVLRDSAPPTGVKSTDLRLSNTLRFSF